MNIPEVTFKARIGDNENLGGGCSIGGKWKDTSTKELFNNKKIVLFSLPGAYTPTCSSQQLPGYEEAYQGFRDLGIDDIYCFTVNDTFVTQEWAQSLGIVNVKVIPDGSAEFTVKMNMDVRKDNLGFGLRSWRYAALVESGRISLEFVEEGFGDNIGDDPYIISNPYNVTAQRMKTLLTLA